MNEQFYPGESCVIPAWRVQIKLLTDNAVFPTKGSEDAAGYDLYITETTVVRKGCTEILPTGLSIELPENHVARIYSRSGFAKDGLVVANGVGVIDADYRGEVGVLIHNQGKFNKIIKAGTRVAQMIIEELPYVEMIEVKNLGETDRGSGGFGSTGAV